jgi:poly-gamma-glutamate capsule biosynthesis protein CapA/YwtB (metallophosphatase superfamily)
MRLSEPCPTMKWPSRYVFEAVKRKFVVISLFLLTLSGLGCTLSGFRNQSVFLGSPEIMGLLPRSEITIASLANNHVLDCGREGLLETMREFKKHGIMAVGAGRSVTEACRPLILNINGFRVAMMAYLEMDPAVLSYIGISPEGFSADHGTVGVASWKLCSGQKQIAEMRKGADIVLVFVHMHHTKFSWSEAPSTASILFVKNILDAGADIVVGSGPHVPQGIISNDKGVALISLGNFLFHPNYRVPEKGHRSILANFIISGDDLRLTVTPLRLDSLGLPRIALKEDASIILNRIVSLSSELGTTLQIQGDRGFLEIQRLPANVPSRVVGKQ